MAEISVPPHSPDAERSVLGSILLDTDIFPEVAEILSAEDFCLSPCRLVFEAMLSLYNEGSPLDLISLREALARRGVLDEVGGDVFLMDLMEAVPSSALALHYAEVVKDKARLRRFHKALSELSELCLAPGMKSEEVVREAEGLVSLLAGTSQEEGISDGRRLIKKAVKTLEALATHEGGVTGLSTGFYNLDGLTTGLHPGDFVVVAARPGMGKTAFALDIALHAAVKKGKRVAFFSLEMPREQIAFRMLANLGKVPFSKLRMGKLSSDDWRKVNETANKIVDADIVVDDTPALSILSLRARARRLALEKPLDLLVVDYLQLMRAGGRTESRQQEISEISRGLKMLAKELEVPVLALSQLSRAVEARQDKRPQLSDLRESGAIEQDADLVLFIYRPEVYKPHDPSLSGIAEIIVAKQRNGPMGVFNLTFLKEYTSFENYAEEEEEAVLAS